MSDDHLMGNPYAKEEYQIYLGLNRLLNAQEGITKEEPMTFELFKLICPVGTHRMLQEMTRCLCLCKRLEPLSIVEKYFVWE